MGYRCSGLVGFVGLRFWVPLNDGEFSLFLLEFMLRLFVFKRCFVWLLGLLVNCFYVGGRFVAWFL